VPHGGRRVGELFGDGFKLEPDSGQQLADPGVQIPAEPLPFALDLADRAPAPPAAGSCVQVAFRRHQPKAVAHQAALERQQAASGPPRGFGGPRADPQPPAGRQDARELQEPARRGGLSGQDFRVPDGPAGPFAHREDAAAQVAFHN